MEDCPNKFLTHSSSEVFPELAAESTVSPEEWMTTPCDLTMGCGCVVPVNTGDTFWFANDEGYRVAVAIDRVTVH